MNMRGAQLQLNTFGQTCFTMAAMLVDYLQMVEDVRIASQCIKSFEGQKGVPANPLQPPLPTSVALLFSVPKVLLDPLLPPTSWGKK